MWLCAVRPRGSPVQISISGEYSASYPARFSSGQPALSSIGSGLINHNNNQQNKVTRKALMQSLEVGTYKWVPAGLRQPRQPANPVAVLLKLGSPQSSSGLGILTCMSLRHRTRFLSPASPTKANKVRVPSGCECFTLHEHFTAIILFNPPRDPV